MLVPPRSPRPILDRCDASASQCEKLVRSRVKSNIVVSPLRLGPNRRAHELCRANCALWEGGAGIRGCPLGKANSHVGDLASTKRFESALAGALSFACAASPRPKLPRQDSQHPLLSNPPCSLLLCPHVSFYIILTTAAWSMCFFPLLQ